MRSSKTFRVFFIEEPVFSETAAMLRMEVIHSNLFIVTPHLPHGLNEEQNLEKQRLLLTILWSRYSIDNYIAWFYTPMALPLTNHLPEPSLTVYDCMDELSGFKNAPPEMRTRESELFQQADLVFTGGQSLYEAKRSQHYNIHAFPSSIDKKHFSKARSINIQPAEQSALSHPRIGFFGVIDERMDTALLTAIATQYPEWNIILIGPVVKIDPSILPALPNIHYLGSRSYDELPSYLGGWDVAIIPFALNESTQFISPTKTPEYLAGGVPVVSTAIRDIMHPYEDNGLVYVGKNHNDFIEGIVYSLTLKKSSGWIRAVDLFLKDLSWDHTWDAMLQQVNKALMLQHEGALQNKAM